LTAINVGCVLATVRLLRCDWGLAATAAVSPAVLTMVAYEHFGGVLALLAT
jgi:hypothetical protein